MKCRRQIEGRKSTQGKLITTVHDAHKGLIVRVVGDSVRSFKKKADHDQITTRRLQKLGVGTQRECCSVQPGCAHCCGGKEKSGVAVQTDQISFPLAIDNLVKSLSCMFLTLAVPNFGPPLVFLLFSTTVLGLQ
jgi:hypothetical protein